MTTDDNGMSNESATALAAERGLGFLQYGDLLSLRCLTCDTSWEPAKPWQPTDLACTNAGCAQG